MPSNPREPKIRSSARGTCSAASSVPASASASHSQAELFEFYGFFVVSTEELDAQDLRCYWSFSQLPNEASSHKRARASRVQHTQRSVFLAVSVENVHRERGHNCWPDRYRH